MLSRIEDAKLDKAVDTLRFLSDRNRLRILGMLMESETCVCEVIDELDLPQPLVSYHLRKLRDAGLVRARRRAQWIYYSIDPEGWDAVIGPLDGLFGTPELPPAAQYGASNRCDNLPPLETTVTGEDEKRDREKAAAAAKAKEKARAKTKAASNGRSGRRSLATR